MSPRGAATVTVPAPAFAHLGPDDTPATVLRAVAHRLRNGWDPGGSNVRAGIAHLLDDVRRELESREVTAPAPLTLTDEQRAEIREFCGREHNEGIYDPDDEDTWLWAYALAAAADEVKETTAARAADFWGDASESWSAVGPGPWSVQLVDEADGYTIALVVNGRLLAAPDVEGGTILEKVADLRGLLDQVRRAAELDVLRAVRDQILAGPTFPLPPGIIAELIEERITDLGGGGS